MFDNIGGKIKTWAQILCILGIIGSVIWAIAILMQSSYYHVTILESALILGLGSLGSWVGSFITYGLVPSSIMRKFIYKSGRTQSAQGRETCP